MIISVDIKRIDDHLLILNEELKETQAILELFKIRYEQTSADITSDKTLLRRQMDCIKKQEVNISNRIELLETMASKFLNSVYKTENAVNEAVHILLDSADG